MTPEATMACAEERQRADISLAWTTAMLHRSKDFPRSPDSLWGGSETRRGIPEGIGDTDHMLADAKARFEVKQKQQTAEGAINPMNSARLE